jgi:hypothetical protein
VDAQFRRTVRRDPASFTAGGVVGVLAACGFAFALLWPVLGPELQLRTAAPPRSAMRPEPGVGAAPGHSSVPSPAPAAALRAPETPPLLSPNARPRIESVSVRGAVTAASDVRLEIAASDSDSDPVALRTRWTINDRSLETEAPVLSKSEIQRGDRIRATVVAHDGRADSEPFVTPVFTVQNAIPAITTFPSGFEASGAFVYPVGAVDPDGDSDLVYRLVEGPGGMTLEREGRLHWSPRADQVGRHSVVVEVRDGRGALDRQAFDLTVRSPGRPPGPADRVDAQ